MSGRGNRNGSRGGRGGRGGGRGRGKGRGYSGSSGASKKQGLCAALGNYVFDYNNKGAADQMRVSWEKLYQYVGTQYGKDIMNELQNKQEVVIPQPEHTEAVRNRHTARTTLVFQQQR